MPFRMRSVLLSVCLLLPAVTSNAQDSGNATVLALGLKSPDAAARAQAASRLAALGPKAAPALPQLVDVLLDPDANVRREILHAFRAIGPRAGEAAPTVAILLRHEDADTRMQTLETLRAIGSSDAGVVGPLIYALDDEIPAVRAASASLIAEFGDPADSAIPRLVRVSEKDPSDSVRTAARAALAHFGPANGLAPRMAAKLRSPDVGVRTATATSLSEMGNDARRIVPQLRRAMRDPDAGVRFAAAHTIVRVAPDSASVRKALAAMVSDPKEDRIERAKLASDATLSNADLTQAVPALVIQTKSPDLLTRKGAVVVLGNLRPLTEPTIQALIAALDDADPDVRALSAESLGGMGPAAKAALPALDRLRTTDRDRSVRVFSAAAFDRIDSQ